MTIRQRYVFRDADILVRSGAKTQDGLTALNCQPASLPRPLERIDLAEGVNAGLYSPDTEAPAGWEWQPFRSIIRELPECHWLMPARALSLLNWRTSTRFCGRCGAVNGDKADETARLCPACGALSFPRISPAILAAVTRADKLLLARNTLFKTGIWSVIAGFLEPGETFEQCVCREVREEVAIEIEPGDYLGSQPWPFPDQLMVGFTAQWKSGELRPDGREISEAAWFGPDDHPPLPLPGSLSRRVIDQAFAAIRASSTRL